MHEFSEVKTIVLLSSELQKRVILGPRFSILKLLWYIFKKQVGVQL